MYPTLALIGTGRVGQALATLLANQGFPLGGLYNRSPAVAAALAAALGGQTVGDPAAAARTGDIVLIAVSDGAIADMAAAAAAGGGFRPGQVVLHLSGALDSAVLAPARAAGAAVGSMHPLVSMPTSAAGIAHLPSAPWALEGDGAAMQQARTLVTAIGARCWELAPGAKALYHAGAVLACNYLVTLVGLAQRTWATAGIPPAEAVPGLTPLLQSTLANLEAYGLPAALTGPIRRGDIDTVARHLQALAANAPDVAALYRSLGLHTVPMAESTGLSPAAAASLRRLLAPVCDPLPVPSAPQPKEGDPWDVSPR